MIINKTKGTEGARKGNPSLRRCVSCREMIDKRELLRIVKSPEGDFAIDETGKAAGRGAYVCKCENCVKTLEKNRGLDRSFKSKVPQKIYDRLREKNNEKS